VGAFNLVEGIVDHHLLGVHDVRDDVADPLWWNVGFLVLGALLVAVGVVLVRRGGPPTRASSGARTTPGEHRLAHQG
jgi:uncharacterized membrane protein